MRKFLLSLVFAITAIAVQAQDPAITMTTSLPNGSDVEFYLASLVDNTSVQIDWGNGNLANITIGQYNTTISGTSAGNTIKIYGSGITSLYASYLSLTALNISKATSLTDLTVSNNQLQSLDIASNTNLKYLDCSKNQLEVLSVTNNIKLEKIYCFKNKLTTIDITSNADLWELDCSNNLMTTLNFSSVTNDVDIDCSNNLLTSLTLGNNMSSVRCKNNALTSLDISLNTSLYLLDCSNNQLSSLNLSNNGNLQYLICSYNKISSLDLSHNPLLTELYCTYNKLTFTTLPITNPNWNVYDYNPQKSLELPKKNYEIEESIDLSSQLAVNSVNSVYTWKTKSGQTLTGGTDYAVSNGVFKFNSAPTDSVYCEITNTTYTGLTLTTNAILITAPVPNVVMTTTTAVGSSFSFSIGATANSTPIKVDWGNGTLASYTIETTSKTISGTLTGNTIKIYGVGINYLNIFGKKLTFLDVTNNTALTSLNCESNQLTSLDVTKNIALTFLNSGHNQLTSLDVTSNTALTKLYCYSNQLSSLDVTKNTALTELGCSDNKITALDVTNNTALTELNCKSNRLNALDVTNNTVLTYLDCYSNQLNTLNVTNNAALTYLGCFSNRLNALDVTNNTALSELYCFSNQLTVLDVTNNTALTALGCGSNQLAALDVTNNTALTSLDCYSNQLTALNVSQNTALTKLMNGSNKLTFTTLPIKLTSWTAYTYSPQAKLTLPKIEYTLNEEIDLSSQLTAGGNTTTYVWKTKGGIKLVKDVHYIENNGKFTFIKQPDEYFYCEMRNATFPELTLVTENISITQTEPSITMITTIAVGNTFSFQIKSTSDNAPIKVDWGNGTLANYTIGTSLTTVSGTLTGNSIKIYGLGINHLNLFNKKLTFLDITKNTTLAYLDCYANQLTSLDVTNNTALTYLNCPSNQLTSLDVTKNTALTFFRCYSNQLTSLDVTKNTKLTQLSCEYNKLTSLDVTKNTELQHLHCESNQLTTLDVTKNTELFGLGCSYNKITSLNVTQNIRLYELWCSNLQLSSLNVSNNTKLTKLDCSNNIFTFTTLPIKQTTWTSYDYSPQAKLALPKTEYALNEEIDLSSQLTSGSNTTVYIWKTAGGVTLIKNVDYTENNGKFTFIKQPGDYFFCEMTNATFPELTLATENIFITQTEPSITMITTTTGGSTLSFGISATANNASIKVDWGNGTLASYTVGTSSSTVSGTLAGNTIKIYGVGINYLNLYNKNLTSLDVTNNTSLTTLNCNSNQLTVLDVTKNTALTALSCSSNQLTTLDVTQNTALTDLYCSSNQLTALDVTNNTALTRLDCYTNQLNTLDVTQNKLLTTLYCYSNQLTALDVSKNAALKYFYCESNQLTFSTLPIKQTTWISYYYSPQSVVKLAKKQYGLTETVDLSSELTVNSNTTAYTWKTKGGTTLVAGTDYNVTGGVTSFLKVQTDSVYCQMTNATFPDLTLTTTNIKVSEYPLSVGDNEVAIKVYPNPATENFTIKMAEEIIRVEVYTITGVKVFENGLYSSTTVNVPLTSMPKGALLIKAYTRNGVYRGKVVKI